MNMIKKNLIAVSVAASIFAAGAQAATVNNPSTATVPAYGKNIISQTVRTVITPVVTVVTLGAGESLSVDDSVTFTLNNGATFAAVASGDLTEADTVADGDGTAGNATATFALVAGGAGQNFATFRVTTAPSEAAAKLNLAATATFNGTAVADGAAIDVTVTMSGFVGGVATSLFGSPLISLNTDLVDMMTATSTAVTGTFNVAGGFKELTSATSSDVAAPFNSSNTATVTVTTNAAAVANSTTAGVPAAVPTPAKTLLQINGPMAGVASIGVTGGATSSNADGTAPTGGTTANAFLIDATNNAAYATTTAGGPYVITFNFDETVTHDLSSYSTNVQRLADTAGGYSATTVATGLSTASFNRNGSSFTSNSIGPLNRVSVTDRSGVLGAGGADGAINITAFDAAGNSVTCTGLTVPNLPNNGTVVVQGSDITSSCAGAKRVEGVVNSTSILVTNVKTTADGATATPGLSSSGATSAN